MIIYILTSVIGNNRIQHSTCQDEAEYLG